MKQTILLLREMFQRTLRGRRAWCGFLFVLPWILGAALFFAYPLYRSLIISFHKIVNVSDFQLEWAGLNFYRAAIFDDVNFIPMFLKNAGENLLNLPLINIFALIIAMMLNRKIKGRGLFRSLFFLPVMLGTGFIMQQLLGQKVDQEAMEFARGLLLPEQVRVYLGPSGSRMVQEFLARMTQIFWRSGVQIVIFLSGLQSISSSLYEAARVDSATEWESFWMITLPMMAPTIQLNLVYTIIDNFTVADNPIIEFIKNMAFNTGEPAFEFSAAISWLYCLFILLAVGIIFLLTTRFTNQVKEKI